MKAIKILVLAWSVLSVAGCTNKHETADWWGPLLVKYVGTGPIRTDPKTGDRFILDCRKQPPTRIMLTVRPLDVSNSRTQVLRYEYPELAGLLRERRIPVTNDLVAVDIRNLLVLAQGHCFDMQDYLTERVQTRNQGEWILEDHYWGAPDDEHRRPMRITHHILTDAAGCFSNMVTDVHPRKIDMEAQNNGTEPIR
jgi:hypothetical protein